MTEVLYLTEPDDPLLPKVQAAARGRLRLTVKTGSFDLKNAADFDALLIGDVRLGSRIEKLAVPKLIQLTRGDHPDLDVLALNSSGVTVSGASPALAQHVASHALALALTIRWVYGPRGLQSRDEITLVLENYRSHLRGVKAGIIGFGRIGQEMARMLRFTEATVTYADIRTAGHGRAVDLQVRRSTLDRLLASSDIVFMHAQWGPASNLMIGARELRLMGSASVLVNTADGRLVDEQALESALRSKKIGGAALDVVSGGTPVASHPLANLPNVVLTPYVAARSDEADDAVASFVVENIERALAGDSPQGMIEVIGLPRSGDPAFWSSRMSPRE